MKKRLIDKKLKNHEHAVALCFFAYTFPPRHATLRMPPAMKVKVTLQLTTKSESC